jgi:hypothetical protein
MRRLVGRWTSIACLVAAGCQGQGAGSAASADEYFYDCEDAARPAGLTVFATDETFQEFVNKDAAAAPTRSDVLAPRLNAPPSPGKLSAASAPTFSFSAIQMASGSKPAARKPGRRGVGRWLWSLVEGTAWAHCPAVSGDNYLFRVNDGDTTVYTALLSVTSFTPGAAAWKRALDGRLDHPVTITIERATFSTGSITLGPYLATIAPTFSVGP